MIEDVRLLRQKGDLGVAYVTMMSFSEEGRPCDTARAFSADRKIKFKVAAGTRLPGLRTNPARSKVRSTIPWACAVPIGRPRFVSILGWARV
jgi:hypothetical protein